VCGGQALAVGSCELATAAERPQLLLLARASQRVAARERGEDAALEVIAGGERGEQHLLCGSEAEERGLAGETAHPTLQVHARSLHVVCMLQQQEGKPQACVHLGERQERGGALQHSLEALGTRHRVPGKLLGQRQQRLHR